MYAGPSRGEVGGGARAIVDAMCGTGGSRATGPSYKYK